MKERERVYAVVVMHEGGVKNVCVCRSYERALEILRDRAEIPAQYKVQEWLNDHHKDHPYHGSQFWCCPVREEVVT